MVAGGRGRDDRRARRRPHRCRHIDRRCRGRSQSDDEQGSTASETSEKTADDSGDTGPDDSAGDEGDGGTSRRRRRRRRGGSSGDGESDDPPGTTTRVREPRSQRDEPTAVKGSTRLEAKKQRRREGREAGRRRTIITEAEFLARRESVERVMVVRGRGDRTQIGAVHLATSLVADLQLIAAAATYVVASRVTEAGLSGAETASVVSLSGGALFANVVSVVLLVVETVTYHRSK